MKTVAEKELEKELEKEEQMEEKNTQEEPTAEESSSEAEEEASEETPEEENADTKEDSKAAKKEKSAMFETGAKSVIEKILPVVDNFERGLATVPESDKDGAFAQGMEMIYKQLLTELESIDVKPIEAVGQEFDPEFHNAVMQVESEEYETGIIAQELQKGYTYRGSVVRHSMVAVVG